MMLPQALLLLAFGIDRFLNRRSQARREQEFQHSQAHSLQALQKIQHSQAHSLQALQEFQQWQAQWSVMVCFFYLVCFLFLMCYVLRQFRRQDEMRDRYRLQLHNDLESIRGQLQRQLHNDLESIRGQLRRQDEMRDRDRLQLGIRFATIYDVWEKKNTKGQGNLKLLPRSPGRNTEVCKVYEALREKDKNGLQFQFPTKKEDEDTSANAMKQSSALRSIFHGPDKSLAHIVPYSLECSWFYGSVAERLVGTAAGAEAAGAEALSAEERAMQRFMLIHDRDHGLKYSSRNLLPLPDAHYNYFDKCIEDCLLIIPIMAPDEMAVWNGEAYDVLVVASSPDVYRWMKLDDRFLEQQPPTLEEISTATMALRTCIADLLHSLVLSGNGPIADGRHLVKKYQREKTRETPSTWSAITTESAQSVASETSKGNVKSTGTSVSKTSKGALKSTAEGKTDKLERTKGKIMDKGFPMPDQREDVEKPLLKVSLEDLAKSSSVPDPLALATKAAINWSAFATKGDKKLLTDCRVSPPIVEGDCDGPDAGIPEETILPEFVYVPTNQGLVRPIPTTATDWSGTSQQPHVVSP